MNLTGSPTGSFSIVSILRDTAILQSAAEETARVMALLHLL
jgi:hypothetical protein